MRGLVHAMVFLLNTALAVVGVVLDLSFAPNPPEGSSLLGTVGSLGGSTEPGAFILKMTRGTGPALRIFFTGHWLVNPTWMQHALKGRANGAAFRIPARISGCGRWFIYEGVTRDECGPWFIRVFQPPDTASGMGRWFILRIRPVPVPECLRASCLSRSCPRAGLCVHSGRHSQRPGS